MILKHNCTLIGIVIFVFLFTDLSFAKEKYQVNRFTSLALYGNNLELNRLTLAKYYIQDKSPIKGHYKKLFINSTLPGTIECVNIFTSISMRRIKQTWGSSAQGGKMINIPLRALIAGVLYIPTIATGFGIAGTGKPYNTLLFTVHKLTAVANLILLNYTVYQENQIALLDGGEIAATIAMNICFVSTIVTGALMSVDLQLPNWVNTLHNTGPWLSFLSSVVLLYLLGN